MLPKPSNTLLLPCFPLGVVGAPGNRPAGKILASPSDHLFLCQLGTKEELLAPLPGICPT